MSQSKRSHSINKVVALLSVFDKDKRYGPEAYSFVMAALGFTTKKLGKKGHVTGGELLDGIKEYALSEFGPMTRTVLEHWGIKRTDDFGEIVFNMIDAGVLGKTEKDTKKDFANRFDFKDAFDKGCKYKIY
ncbi:MAG: Minf_1886 family protein [Candidatus Omnitrophota bacterium]